MSKCPFCHEPLALDRAAWVACAGCLARHHQSCWTEASRCASCGDPRALVLPEKRPRRRTRVARALAGLVRVAALAAVLIAPSIGSALWVQGRLSAQLAATAAQLAATAEELDSVKRALLER